MLLRQQYGAGSGMGKSAAARTAVFAAGFLMGALLFRQMPVSTAAKAGEIVQGYSSLRAVRSAADGQGTEDLEIDRTEKTEDLETDRTEKTEDLETDGTEGTEDLEIDRTEGTEDLGTDGIEGTDIREEAQDLLKDLGLSEIDSYLQRENVGQLTFTELVKGLMDSGLTMEFAAIGGELKQIVLQDYRENRKILIQILTLAIAFSILLQMTMPLQRNYISNLGFIGIYLIIMLLLLKLFLLMTGVVESFFSKLVEFMQMLQPAFCMSMVFSTGSISAGAYYQLLLLLIYLVDTIFAKLLLPVVQAYMVLQLVNYMTEERFSRIAGLLADSIDWCVRIFTTALVGLNIVQSLLTPGIDGLKRSTVANTVRAIPGAGQIMNSMTEILAGSAMLIKNSVGAAALILLVIISFLPLVKTAVFMLLYRGCAALMEPVADKRFCAAVAALGQSAALYLKLMFYAVLLFFLTTAIICAATTLSI